MSCFTPVCKAVVQGSPDDIKDYWYDFTADTLDSSGTATHTITAHDAWLDPDHGANIVAGSLTLSGNVVGCQVEKVAAAKFHHLWFRVTLSNNNVITRGPIGIGGQNREQPA